jgi:phosphopantetheine--protein transferase-like protein
MIVAVGVDLIQIDRVKKLAKTYPDQLHRIFTQNELRATSGARQAAILAELFAAKEAVSKVLGTGWQRGMSWTDIEILNAKVILRGLAQQMAQKLHLSEVKVATSSTKTKAVAHAIGIR